ncbi:hypothetical protein VTN02DRAFT_2400 [Thermoascus thermophilus]
MALRPAVIPGSSADAEGGHRPFHVPFACARLPVGEHGAGWTGHEADGQYRISRADEAVDAAAERPEHATRRAESFDSDAEDIFWSLSNELDGHCNPSESSSRTVSSSTGSSCRSQRPEAGVDRTEAVRDSTRAGACCGSPSYIPTTGRGGGGGGERAIVFVGRVRV